MTYDQQKDIIERACKLANIGAYTTEIKAEADAHTWAERIAAQYKDKRLPMPIKNSFMYCDTLDMCFFFLRGETPAVAYAGYTTAISSDATGGLVNAFAKANEVLRYMREFQAQEKEKPEPAEEPPKEEEQQEEAPRDTCLYNPGVACRNQDKCARSACSWKKVVP